MIHPRPAAGSHPWRASGHDASPGPARRVAILLTLGWTLLAGPVWALSTDSEQPVHIEADWAEGDEIARTTVYKGKVVVVQGSLRISGDVVTMYFDENRELTRLIAVGRLARFRQKPDGDEQYQRAKANQIQYDVPSNTMVLTGNAELSKGEDRIEADRIVYDTFNARIKGESMAVATPDAPATTSKPGRVTITIKPKRKCVPGTAGTDCPP